MHEKKRKKLFKGSWRESNKETASKSESKKREIYLRYKKFKDYCLIPKEREKVQQISSYNRQKLESKEEPKLKFCITAKEENDQNVSQIPNKEGKRYQQQTKVIKNRF